jgi:hypothetical protein
VALCIQESNRVPTVQECVADGRLGNWATASAGNRVGPSGTKLGQAHRTWACSAAAGLFLRDPLPAQPYLPRLEKQPTTGQALPVLAHQWARAVDDMRNRQVACAKEPCFQRLWRGAAAPGAAWDTQGMHLPHALDTIEMV